MKDNNFDTIPEEFYDNLPEELKDACNLFEGARKDIFLLSLLTAYGATFTNIYCNYRGDTIFPNLYLAVYSRAGSGKSSMKWIRKIFDRINEKEILESPIAPNSDPERKIYRTLFIAPNITSAQWCLQLANNHNHQGIIIATEAETLTKSCSSKDMGGFTDGLRICYENEPYEVMRKTNNEHLIIKEPKLALILSGTPNQITSFIPTAEDGLASRMIYYSFEGSVNWERSTDHHSDINSELDPLKTHSYNLYVDLKERINIKIEFSDKQYEILDNTFHMWIEHGKKNYGNESIPFIFRLAPRVLKIAMILTVLKINSFDYVKNNTAKCSDTDFHMSLTLGYVLLKKSMLFLTSLKNYQVHNKFHGVKYDLLLQLPDEFVTREFLDIANNLNIRKRTAEALLARFAEESLVYKIKKGYYKNLFNQTKTDQNEE
jgi:hypothetical protein